MAELMPSTEPAAAHFSDSKNTLTRCPQNRQQLSPSRQVTPIAVAFFPAYADWRDVMVPRSRHISDGTSSPPIH